MLRVAVFALCTIALTLSASAFGSINSLGQQSEREKITRLGLAGFRLGPETMDEIAGKTKSAGAVGVPDVPGRGLINSTEAHCDGGDYFEVAGYLQPAAEAAAALGACRRFVFRALRRAVDAASGIADENGDVNSAEIPSILPCIYDGSARRAKCNVLEQMGLALHAAQDFYSHSNWVDIVTGLPTVENPPGPRAMRPGAVHGSDDERLVGAGTDQRLLRGQAGAGALHI